MADKWLRAFRSAGDGCARCGTKTRLLQSYCAECKAFVNSTLTQYSAAARNVLAHSGPLGPEWITLHEWLYGARIPRKHALDTIRADALTWLNRYATYALSDGIVTDDELATFRQAARALELEPAAVTHIESQLLREQMLGEIRQGRLPTVQIPGLHLPTDEYCYMVAGATRWRDLQAGPAPSQGQLAVTNRKIRFVAQQHGGEIPLSKVQRVSYLDRTTVLIESTARSLSGRFSVPDAEYTSILVDTALRIDRRILLPDNGDRPSRHIPAHVKSAVYQRDRGVCAECGANSYLEYDHIIPFSRGGASTEGNVQLLCRACNLAKGARV